MFALSHKSILHKEINNDDRHQIIKLLSIMLRCFFFSLLFVFLEQEEIESGWQPTMRPTYLWPAPRMTWRIGWRQSGGSSGLHLVEVSMNAAHVFPYLISNKQSWEQRSDPPELYLLFLSSQQFFLTEAYVSSMSWGGSVVQISVFVTFYAYVQHIHIWIKTQHKYLFWSVTYLKEDSWGLSLVV